MDSQQRRQEWKVAAFRFRYSLEQLAAAVNEFTAVYRRALEDEFERRRVNTQLALARRLRDRELLEAECQEWRRQLEEKTL